MCENCGLHSHGSYGIAGCIMEVDYLSKPLQCGILLWASVLTFTRPSLSLCALSFGTSLEHTSAICERRLGRCTYIYMMESAVWLYYQLVIFSDGLRCGA